jgi:hypothetical protein
LSYPSKQAQSREEAWIQNNRRRAIRVDVRGSSCRVTIEFPELNNHRRFEVCVLAELGGRFLTNGLQLSQLKGYELDTRLFLGPIELKVRSRIVMIDSNSCALEFLNPDPASRQLIRDLFELELTAASMMPYHVFSTVNPGLTHTTVYADGDGNLIELQLFGDRLDGMEGQLRALDVKFGWHRGQPSSLKTTSLGDDRTQGPHYRDRLKSFISNLQGLDPSIRQAAIDAILTS